MRCNGDLLSVSKLVVIFHIEKNCNWYCQKMLGTSWRCILFRLNEISIILAARIVCDVFDNRYDYLKILRYSKYFANPTL